jgi:hypothetical protein
MLPCRHPWHYLVGASGEITWFHWLRPFGNSKIHYWVGPEPEESRCVRMWDFGQGEPFTCSACGEVIHGSRPDEGAEQKPDPSLRIPIRRVGPLG